jgi:hypothetical protein
MLVVTLAKEQRRVCRDKAERAGGDGGGTNKDGSVNDRNGVWLINTTGRETDETRRCE